MIAINNQKVDLNTFPDKTYLLKVSPDCKHECVITWNYESNSELFALICIVRHLRDHGINQIELIMPYLPNARQDRVKSDNDVFTLKYFAEIINSLNFFRVNVIDPHSSVSEALIDNIHIIRPYSIVNRIIYGLEYPLLSDQSITIYYPDEGAMKRYSGGINRPYVFGVKNRDWETGKITSLDVIGDINLIKDKTILIVDDICSRGGTFYYSAKKLKELGAANIYLYVTHCENTILEGELLESGLIDKIYTTNSIYSGDNDKIIVTSI